MSRYSIPEMTCGHCKKTVEGALYDLDAGAKVDVDLEKHEITLTSGAGAEQVVTALKEVGYEATPI